MNVDMYMFVDFKNIGKGNLFVIFGELDIIVCKVNVKGVKFGDIEVQINGVDVFQFSIGEVCSDGVDGIVCWFIDIDYNEESFFVCQVYFFGVNDLYKNFKMMFKVEIDKEVWDSFNSDVFCFFF